MSAPHVIQFVEVNGKVVHEYPVSVRRNRALRDLATARNVYGAARVRLVDRTGRVVETRRSAVVPRVVPTGRPGDPVTPTRQGAERLKRAGIAE